MDAGENASRDPAYRAQTYNPSWRLALPSTVTLFYFAILSYVVFAYHAKFFGNIPSLSFNHSFRSYAVSQPYSLRIHIFGCHWSWSYGPLSLTSNAE